MRPFFIDRRDACPTGRLVDVFASLAFVFFPAIVPRAYTLPAVRYTLIKY
jgi:hypothetical protein